MSQTYNVLIATELKGISEDAEREICERLEEHGLEKIPTLVSAWEMKCEANDESEAKDQAIEYEVTRYDIDDLDRAIADGENRGFVKILTVPGKDKILGATIVGYHAAELLNEFVLAMTHGLGLKKIMSTIHIYPTLSESNKFAASEWRKKNAPEWLYPYLEKFHRWRR